MSVKQVSSSRDFREMVARAQRLINISLVLLQRSG